MTTSKQPFGSDSFNRRDDADEFGLSNLQFKIGQAELERQISAANGAERAKPHHEYFIFESAEDKKKALELISNDRQIDDAFRYLTQWGDDPKNPDLGLALDFSNSPEASEAKILDSLSRNNIKAIRVHHTNDAGHETAVFAANPDLENKRLRIKNVIPFPIKEPPDSHNQNIKKSA